MSDYCSEPLQNCNAPNGIGKTNLQIDALFLNKDKPDVHNLGIEEAKGSEEAMQQTIKSALFQSSTNPKVQVTLEFGNEEMSKCSEEALRSILKNISLEKIKKGAFQFAEPALEYFPNDFTEVEKND